MTYTRDWLESTPIDHTTFSAQPGNVRAHKVDVAERLEDMFSGFISGELEADSGVKILPFTVQTDPGAVTDKIQLYGKDVAAKIELHAQDEDGNVIQLTSVGGLFLDINGRTEKTTVVAADEFVIADSAASNIIKKIFMSTIGKYMYPIGTVLTFGVATNPNTLYGFGTWTAVAGRVIVGIDAGQTEFDTLNETGGAKTHTLTVAEVPALGLSLAMRNANGWDGVNNNIQGSNATGSSGNFTGTTSTGGGGAHQNLPPYIVKFVWERTA